MPATFQPSAPSDLDLHERARVAGRGRRTAVAIARVEARRLVVHPLMVTGSALAAIYAWAVFEDLTPVMARDTVYLAGSSAPIAIAAFLAAHAATGRPRHDGTEDLHDAAPSRAATRTAGLLLAALGPAVVSLVFVVAWTAYLYSADGIGHPNPFELLAAPALAGTAGIGGVALGRWAPSRIVGPLAALVVFAGQGLLLYPWFDGGPNLARLMLHTDWGMGLPAALVPRSPGVHLVHVLGVALVVSAVALLRHRQGMLAPAMATVGLTVAVVTGVWLVQPPPQDRVEQAVALAVDPTMALECRVVDVVEYCVLPPYTPWIGRWHDTIGGVLGAVPPADRPDRLRVEMTLEDTVDHLSDVLYPYLDADQMIRLLRGDTSRQQVPLRVGTSMGGPTGELEDFALALTVSSLVLDIGRPVVVTRGRADEPVPSALDGTGQHDEPHLRCTPVGQAREVLALYLAARSSPSAELGFRRHLELPLDESAGTGDPAVPQDRIAIQPRMAEPGGTRYETLDTPWSLAGAELAAQLLERPATTLGRFQADWSYWTHPTTSHDQLIERFDIAPPPARATAELGLPACP